MTPLWTPSAERIAGARLTEFMDVPDYDALHAWSIERPGEFWRKVWEFCEVIGEPGERTVIDLDKMPGAQFFPDARLNFAENLLRGSDDRIALIFNGEGQRRRTLTMGALRSEVAAFAASAGPWPATG